MTRYAVLGATGNCGLSLLRVLSTHPSANISALVRSRDKLTRLAPDLVHSLTVHEGDITSISALTACIRGATAVFLAIAPPGNVRDSHLVHDTAAAVVRAVRALKAEDPASFRAPLLILLSSAEADDKFYYDTPWPVRSLLFAANYYTYKDLIATERFLRHEMGIDEGVIEAVFFKPGGISHDVQAGHVLSTEKSQTFVSWLDVAGGMVQVADEGAERWSGKCVTVQSKGRARPEYSNAPLLLRGLGTYFRSFLPF